MSYRNVKFAPGKIYHLFNRGVDKRPIFKDNHDRERFQKLLFYYVPRQVPISYSLSNRPKKEEIPDAQANPAKIPEGEGLIDVLCYCFMDNHFHLLVRENIEQGTQQYMQRVLNSYARYFNIRHHRTGPLFSGRFHAVLIGDNEQFLHVSRYIHLNPYVGGVTKDIFNYRWSSLSEYIEKSSPNDLCQTSLLRSLIKPKEYREFMTDYAAYARELSEIKHLLLDD
jgi:putative transposase